MHPVYYYFITSVKLHPKNEVQSTSEFLFPSAAVQTALLTGYRVPAADGDLLLVLYIAREACLPVRSSWWEAGSPDIQPKQASAAALVRSFASQVAEEILTLLPLPFTSLHLPTRECESVCETTVQKSTQRTLPTSWLLWLLA
jgi:hypothetical protein